MTSADISGLARQVAERILGFEEPVTAYAWDDRKKQERPFVRYRKEPNLKWDCGLRSWDFATYVDSEGTKLSRGDIYAAPTFDNVDQAFALVDIMWQRGYEFALRRSAAKWGASFHGTSMPVVPELLDSDSAIEAILRAALRTVEAK